MWTFTCNIIVSAVVSLYLLEATVKQPHTCILLSYEVSLVGIIVQRRIAYGTTMAYADRSLDFERKIHP